MISKIFIIIVLAITLSLASIGGLDHDLKGFDDSILYKIEWPGNEAKDIWENGSELYRVKTHNQEGYECVLPKVEMKEEASKNHYAGPGPLELIEPLFVSPVCSYRVESYWTYEVCHGSHIRQYHEEREGKPRKTVRTQDYILGTWTEWQTEGLRKKLTQSEEDKEPLQYIKLEGTQLPYIALEMGGGTICDLNNKPRHTRVVYVCYQGGKNEVYSIKETSTCNYEAIILSSSLCLHPAYKPQDTEEKTINCVPLENSPKRPRSLLTHELESMKMRYQKIAEFSKAAQSSSIGVFKIDPKDGSVRLELIHTDDSLIKEPTSSVPPAIGHKTLLEQMETPHHPAHDFINGVSCLTGGAGWWKYEFCYGKYVRQYHESISGNVESVYLGYFDRDEHIKWWQEDPNRGVQESGKDRNTVTHLYSGGTICEKTGKPRQTEVKLQCMENPPSSTTISIYLLEPDTCKYVLGVESPLVCDILKDVDKYGLTPDLMKVVKIPSTEPTKQNEDDISKSTWRKASDEL